MSPFLGILLTLAVGAILSHNGSGGTSPLGPSGFPEAPRHGGIPAV